MLPENRDYKVYAHIHKDNKKMYIGLTKQPVTRRWNNGNGYKGCTYFGRAIEKYGWDSFEHLVIKDGLTRDEACEMERRLIAKFETTNPKHGYNCNLGGFAGSLSEETKEKLRQANIGKKYPESTRMKHSIAAKNRDIRFNERMWKRSVEVKSRRVYQFDKNKDFIKGWDSVSAAASSVGCGHQNIVRCCQGRSHTCCGYYWSYDRDIIVEPIRSSQIIQIDAESGNVIAVYETIQAASVATGISKENICTVCNGRRNKAGGYKWARKEVEL